MGGTEGAVVGRETREVTLRVVNGREAREASGSKLSVEEERGRVTGSAFGFACWFISSQDKTSISHGLDERVDLDARLHQLPNTRRGSQTVGDKQGQTRARESTSTSTPVR